MPIHDWSRVPSGLFHDFHQSWSIRIKDALNSGRLPKGVAALVEQRAGPKESDVLAIEVRPKRHLDEELDSGIATLPPPVTRIVRRTTKEIYASRANRIVIKHHLGRIIAVIEIVSPGNKDSRAALRDFVEKTVDCLRKGIHVLIVDLFPPTQRDPYGIHKVIWDEIVEEDFTFPDGKDLILVSYKTGGERQAYIEPVTVGDALPDMPLFLTNDLHVMVPLEPTYQATWDASPEELRTRGRNGGGTGARSGVSDLLILARGVSLSSSPKRNRPRPGLLQGHTPLAVGGVHLETPKTGKSDWPVLMLTTLSSRKPSSRRRDASTMPAASTVNSGPKDKREPFSRTRPHCALDHGEP